MKYGQEKQLLAFVRNSQCFSLFSMHFLKRMEKHASPSFSDKSHFRRDLCALFWGVEGYCCQFRDSFNSYFWSCFGIGLVENVPNGVFSLVCNLHWPHCFGITTHRFNDCKMVTTSPFWDCLILKNDDWPLCSGRRHRFCRFHNSRPSDLIFRMKKRLRWQR